MNTKTLRVVLADDQDLIREALRALLSQEPGIDIVGQARTGFEAVETAKRVKPDVILMDVRMPGLSGPEATARIKVTPQLRSTRVLILTTFEDSEVVRACMRAGADGFIGKGASTTSLVDAIHAVCRGESPLSPKAARTLLNDLTSAARVDTPASTTPSALTARETDIVKLVGLGLTNEEIGRRLSISAATAKTHVRNAMRKLETHDRAQLVALVHRIGLE